MPSPRMFAGAIRKKSSMSGESAKLVGYIWYFQSPPYGERLPESKVN